MTVGMASQADAIAEAVLAQYARLPRKRKPMDRGNGVREWVPLSGIVAKDGGSYRCLALATGMKCLPASKLPDAKGAIIHDWHAEVLTVRAFNQFLLEECRTMALGTASSEYLCRRSENEVLMLGAGLPRQPFAWRDGVTLHMYCSEAPCGDASMELIMASQEDATPWEVPPPTDEAGAGEKQLPGRGYFSQLGVVRRKPARGDAPPTLSKSCSDKLALKQCASLLLSVSSFLVHPQGLYFETIVLPESQYSAVACSRSFGPEGRMKEVKGGQWPGGYAYCPFEVETTHREFEFSRRALAAHAAKGAASNLAVAWSLRGLEESLVGGVLQGRKQTDVRGASAVSRRNLWRAMIDVRRALDNEQSGNNPTALLAGSYGDLKMRHELADRRNVLEDVKARALRHWLSNVLDKDFAINEQGGSQL